jgi:hypothetical protein
MKDNNGHMDHIQDMEEDITRTIRMDTIIRIIHIIRTTIIIIRIILLIRTIHIEDTKNGKEKEPKIRALFLLGIDSSLGSMIRVRSIRDKASHPSWIFTAIVCSLFPLSLYKSVKNAFTKLE